MSENCKWRIQKRFEKGELANLRVMYGYRISKDGIEIEPSHAAVVQMIFEDYISSMGCVKISQKLRSMDAPSVYDGVWSQKRVLDILKNEKYAGNALLQKSYIGDHLTKVQVKNNNVLPIYYAEQTHPPIINKDTFKKAQEILAGRREKNGAKTTTAVEYPFTGMIFCCKCGKPYWRKTNQGKPIWGCSTYLKYGKKDCSGHKLVPQDVLIRETVKVLNLTSFDEAEFRRRVKKMIVSGSNCITYIFNDGNEIEIEWQNKSRRESWTDEMKQKAREKSTQNLRCEQ